MARWRDNETPVPGRSWLEHLTSYQGLRCFSGTAAPARRTVINLWPIRHQVPEDRRTSGHKSRKLRAVTSSPHTSPDQTNNAERLPEIWASTSEIYGKTREQDLSVNVANLSHAAPGEPCGLARQPQLCLPRLSQSPPSQRLQRLLFLHVRL